jgi:hypothetical protein
MAVRPFYMTADIEGRATELSGGPRSKNGYQNIKINQRNKGEIETAFTICSYSIDREGKHFLVTSVSGKDGIVIAKHETEY